MKGITRGRLLKKLKSIGQIGYPKHNRVLRLSASDGFFEDFIVKSNLKASPQFPLKDPEAKKVDQTEPEDVIDVSELMRDLEDDEEMRFHGSDYNKENILPPNELQTLENPSKENFAVPVFSETLLGQIEKSQEVSETLGPGDGNPRQPPLSELDISAFRKPDLNSSTLFDPNLLAAFHQAVSDHTRISESVTKIRTEEPKSDKIEEPPLKARRVECEEIPNPLFQFEEKCPPGGSDSVILYTTSLRGIRKTFEDCSSVRFLLESFRVVFFERDVSMHMEFREELWGIMGGRAVPPRLFIKGRDIGGAEAVVRLHEQGKLRPLFEGIPVDRFRGIPCEGCTGIRFVLCFRCNGGRKIVSGESAPEMCPECNENGLNICPLCC